MVTYTLIPATGEAEIGKIMVQSQPRQKEKTTKAITKQQQKEH
jgi:hypothetical protein